MMDRRDFVIGIVAAALAPFELCDKPALPAGSMEPATDLHVWNYGRQVWSVYPSDSPLFSLMEQGADLPIDLADWWK